MPSCEHSLVAVTMCLPEEVGIEDAPTTLKSFLWQHFGFPVGTTSATKSQRRHEKSVNSVQVV